MGIFVDYKVFEKCHQNILKRDGKSGKSAQEQLKHLIKKCWKNISQLLFILK